MGDAGGFGGVGQENDGTGFPSTPKRAQISAATILIKIFNNFTDDPQRSFNALLYIRKYRTLFWHFR